MQQKNLSVLEGNFEKDINELQYGKVAQVPEDQILCLHPMHIWEKCPVGC